MKAIICTKYGPPEVLQIRELDRPTPKGNEVLVKVHATAVTSSDCYVRGMNLPFLYRLAAGLVLGVGKPRQPILGMVFAGEVESIGRNATRFKRGDRVFGIDRFAFGAYAGYKTILENGMIAAMPLSATFEEAAALPYGGSLALAFLEAKIKSGQQVLVYGASGAVGTAAIQVVKAAGARVDGVCGPSNVELVKSLGADKVFDYTKEDAYASGGAYDVVFDAVGKRKSKNFKYLRLLSPGGRFLSVDHGTPKLRPEFLITLKELTENGKMKPVIDRCYPLEEIVEAHRYVDKGHKKGNVIITMNGSGSA